LRLKPSAKEGAYSRRPLKEGGKGRGRRGHVELSLYPSPLKVRPRSVPDTEVGAGKRPFRVRRGLWGWGEGKFSSLPLPKAPISGESVLEGREEGMIIEL